VPVVPVFVEEVVVLTNCLEVSFTQKRGKGGIAVFRRVIERHGKQAKAI
jgi:hypothetical protein